MPVQTGTGQDQIGECQGKSLNRSGEHHWMGQEVGKGHLKAFGGWNCYPVGVLEKSNVGRVFQVEGQQKSKLRDWQVGVGL